MRIFDVAFGALAVVLDFRAQAHDLVPVILNRRLGFGELLFDAFRAGFDFGLFGIGHGIRLGYGLCFHVDFRLL